MGQNNEKQSLDNSKATKKLVNDPNSCVNDSLKGYVLANASVKLLEGWNVVVRSDLKEFKKEGKVTLVTG